VPATRLARLADFAFRRRRLVLASWIAALLAAFALVAVAGGDWSADYNTPGSQSKAAADAVPKTLTGAETPRQPHGSRLRRSSIATSTEGTRSTTRRC